jgi:anaerobic magnesium-protoporphyrin IX monomethyl ester cyclase
LNASQSPLAPGAPKVLLGQSYYLRFDAKLWQAMQPYPPLGTLYAAAVLRRRGYDVALFDAILAASEQEWAQALDRHRPRYAVLYEDSFNYLSRMCLLRMRQAAVEMIGMAKERGCTVIVSGADASDHAPEYLQAGADFVLIGEGEQTLVELMDRLTGRSNTPLKQIPGLAFIPVRDGAGVYYTPPRPLLADLDSLPFPAWDLVDVPRYRQIWYQRHGYYSMNLVTTRGCPYRCNWCAKPIWGQSYHVRSPENVAQELAWLREAYAPDHIWIVDDIMGLKPGWLARFAELVNQQGPPIPFKCLTRADLLNQDTVSALRQAGCRTVWIGAESGSQRVLDAMEKGIRVEQIAEAARRLHEAGIEVGFFLQFGYPGEDRTDIEHTRQMVRDCRPDDIGVSVSYPLPGTRFYERVKDQLGVQQNWLDSSDLAMLYRGPYSTQFYRQLHTVVHKEFRARRAWRQLAAGLRHPTSLGHQDLRRALAGAYHLLTLPLAQWRMERLARPNHGPLAAEVGRPAAAPSRPRG